MRSYARNICTLVKKSKMLADITVEMEKINDIYAIEDTAVIETWYRPDIRSDCRIMLAENGAVYDILNEPEDMEQRHKYCKFKVQRIKGGA